MWLGEKEEPVSEGDGGKLDKHRINGKDVYFENQLSVKCNRRS